MHSRIRECIRVVRVTFSALNRVHTTLTATSMEEDDDDVPDMDDFAAGGSADQADESALPKEPGCAVAYPTGMYFLVYRAFSAEEPSTLPQIDLSLCINPTAPSLCCLCLCLSFTKKGTKSRRSRSIRS
jgi:hypothetical protein